MALSASQKEGVYPWNLHVIWWYPTCSHLMSFVSPPTISDHFPIWKENGDENYRSLQPLVPKFPSYPRKPPPLQDMNDLNFAGKGFVHHLASVELDVPQSDLEGSIFWFFSGCFSFPRSRRRCSSSTTTNILRSKTFKTVSLAFLASWEGSYPLWEPYQGRKVTIPN